MCHYIPSLITLVKDVGVGKGPKNLRALHGPTPRVRDVEGPQTHAPPHLGYQAEFGDFRSNNVGVSKGSHQKSRALGSIHPLGWEHSWSLRNRPLPDGLSCRIIRSRSNGIGVLRRGF